MLREDPDNILRKIAGIEEEIEELLDYRSKMEGHHRDAAGWWPRYKASMQYILIRRQVENHLRYLRFERRLAQESYKRQEGNAHPDTTG